MNLIYLIQELRLHVAVALLIVAKRVFFVLSLKEVNRLDSTFPERSYLTG
jgi:hypothetical protein